jgi:hypothetical protein
VKYLQILNLAVLALGAALALVMAVVCLLYGVHLDTEPRLRQEFTGLLTLTAGFAGFGAAGALAFFGHRGRWMLRWPLQALPLAPLAGILLFLLGLRG